jgi:hypothetical protein
VQAGGGEVHVPRHELAGLDQQLRQNVLGAAALVSGDDEAVAVVLLHGFFEVVEVLAAGVGLVAQHHAGPLPVAHRAGARVGQQVDVDVVALEQEGVVAGLTNGPLAVFERGDVQRLDDLYFPRFGPAALRRSDWLGGHWRRPCTSTGARDHRLNGVRLLRFRRLDSFFAMKKATITRGSAAQILRALKISRSTYTKALMKLGLEEAPTQKKAKPSKRLRQASLSTARQGGREIHPL